MADQENAEPITPGQRIQKLREAAGMSEAGLADHLGVSQNAIKQMEAAGPKNYPSLPNGIKIARLFGVEPEWIVYGDSAKPLAGGAAHSVVSLLPGIEARVAQEVETRLRPFLARLEKIDQALSQSGKASDQRKRKAAHSA